MRGRHSMELLRQYVADECLEFCVFFLVCWFFFFFFFFQAEDGIRDGRVTGVQTCALPICTIFGLRRGASRRLPTQGTKPKICTIFGLRRGASRRLPTQGTKPKICTI